MSDAQLQAVQAYAVEPDITVNREEDPPEIQAAKYLLMKERKYSMTKISEVFGFKSRSSLYDLIATWDREGILERARQAMLLPKAEEIRAATSNVLNQWPLVIERILKIAIHGKSDRNALEAAAWLKQEIIDPALAEQEQAGSSEAAWSRKPDVPPPTTITIPSFLVKKTG